MFARSPLAWRSRDASAWLPRRFLGRCFALRVTIKRKCGRNARGLGPQVERKELTSDGHLSNNDSFCQRMAAAPRRAVPPSLFLTFSLPSSVPHRSRCMCTALQMIICRHRSPSFWRSNFNFGATAKPPAPMKAEYATEGPFAFFITRQIKRSAVYLIHRNMRFRDCSKVKVASPEAWWPMFAGESASLSLSPPCFGMNVFNNKRQFSPLARGCGAAVIRARAREAAVYLKRAIRVISLCGSFTIFGHWMHGRGEGGGLGQTNLEHGRAGRQACQRIASWREMEWP